VPGEEEKVETTKKESGKKENQKTKKAKTTKEKEAKDVKNEQAYMDYVRAVSDDGEEDVVMEKYKTEYEVHHVIYEIESFFIEHFSKETSPVTILLLTDVKNQRVLKRYNPDVTFEIPSAFTNEQTDYIIGKVRDYIQSINPCGFSITISTDVNPYSVIITIQLNENYGKLGNLSRDNYCEEEEEDMVRVKNDPYYSSSREDFSYSNLFKVKGDTLMNRHKREYEVHRILHEIKSFICRCNDSGFSTAEVFLVSDPEDPRVVKAYTEATHALKIPFETPVSVNFIVDAIRRYISSSICNYEYTIGCFNSPSAGYAHLAFTWGRKSEEETKELSGNLSGDDYYKMSIPIQTFDSLDKNMRTTPTPEKNLYVSNIAREIVEYAKEEMDLGKTEVPINFREYVGVGPIKDGSCYAKSDFANIYIPTELGLSSEVDAIISEINDLGFSVVDKKDIIGINNRVKCSITRKSNTEKEEEKAMEEKEIEKKENNEKEVSKGPITLEYLQDTSFYAKHAIPLPCHDLIDQFAEIIDKYMVSCATNGYDGINIFATTEKYNRDDNLVKLIIPDKYKKNFDDIMAFIYYRYTSKRFRVIFEKTEYNGYGDFFYNIHIDWITPGDQSPYNPVFIDYDEEVE
jgi:hypothetical protein